MVKIAQLTDQSRARRERGYETGLTFEYEAGSFEDRVAGLPGILQFPAPGEEDSQVEEAWIMKTRHRWLELLVGKKSFDAYMRTHPKRGHLDALWEIAGIEFELTNSSGLVRMEDQYKRWREARDKQREMLDESTNRTPSESAIAEAEAEPPKA